ncbi:hypothetical protein KBC99_03305, partial [Candidatus Saccharibacteria bacterium]|nr:hypothetical protein [Candidatus Saccharibacteria bacterium]
MAETPQLSPKEDRGSGFRDKVKEGAANVGEKYRSTREKVDNVRDKANKIAHPVDTAKQKVGQAADKKLDSMQKAGAGTVGGEAAGLAKTLKDAKAGKAGKADVAAAGLRAGASATGVGGAAVKGWDAAKKAADAVGIKLKDKYVIYIGIFGLMMSLMPFIILALVLFWAWDSIGNVLKLGFLGPKLLTVAIGLLTLIDHNGASKLAYEVYKDQPNTVIAAQAANKPEEGTYEYKLGLIDWEKAKYQTIAIDSNCEIKTRKVVSTIDGKERSVIDKITIKSNGQEVTSQVARSNCIDQHYPVFNTILRSQFIREGANRNLNIRYSYAEPVGSSRLDQATTEFSKTLQQKSLARIWNRGSNYQVEGKIDQAALDSFENETIKPRETYIQKYTSSKYSREVLDCANLYIPDGKDYYDKHVDKMKHDIKCGIDPKDLLLWLKPYPDSYLNDPDPAISIKPQRAAVNIMCDFYERLLSDKQSPDGQTFDAVENYRTRVKDRINSAAIAGMQALTYADTHKARFINIKELSGDFYKIAGSQDAQEYNYALNYKTVGTPLEGDAVSRILGYYNKTYSANQQEKEYIDALTALFDAIEKPIPGENGSSMCDAAQRQGDFNSFATREAIVRYGYSVVWPKFRAAMAKLDYYARPNQTLSVSQIYKNLDREDISFRIFRIESNAATSGTEDGPQNFNRMNFGTKAYSSMITLAMGGNFLKPNKAAEQENIIREARMYNDKTRGLAYRLFESTNPTSLVSRFKVALIDKPQHIVGNIGSVLSSVMSPIRNAASEPGTLVSMLSGETRMALASNSYDINNLKLDPAGIPEVFQRIDPIQNAREIENLKKTNEVARSAFFVWDLCFQESIPSRFHLENPEPIKANLYQSCRQLFDDKNNDPNQLSVKYRAYHYFNLQADALVYLSNPDKEDISFNANQSSNLTADNIYSFNEGENTALPANPQGDTSALPCPTGTSAAGTGDV